MVAFFGLGVYYLTRPLTEIQVQEKIVFACFFAGAMVCMGLSFLYHTLCCHNNKAIGRLFAKYVIYTSGNFKKSVAHFNYLSPTSSDIDIYVTQQN